MHRGKLKIRLASALRRKELLRKQINKLEIITVYSGSPNIKTRRNTEDKKLLGYLKQQLLDLEKEIIYQQELLEDTLSENSEEMVFRSPSKENNKVDNPPTYSDLTNTSKNTNTTTTTSPTVTTAKTSLSSQIPLSTPKPNLVHSSEKPNILNTTITETNTFNMTANTGAKPKAMFFPLDDLASNVQTNDSKKNKTINQNVPRYDPKANYNLPTDKEQMKRNRSIQNLEHFLQFEQSQEDKNDAFSGENFSPKQINRDSRYSVKFNENKYNPKPNSNVNLPGNAQYKINEDQKPNFNFDSTPRQQPKNHQYNLKSDEFGYNTVNELENSMKNVDYGQLPNLNRQNDNSQNRYFQDNENEYLNRTMPIQEYRNVEQNQNQMIRKTFMYRLREVPKFNGESYQQLIDFIDAMDTLSYSCINTSESNELQTQMLLQLRGEARSIISNLDTRDWYSVKNKLKAHFAYLSNRNVITSQLENLRQGENETLSEYADRARKLLKERNSTFGHITEDQRAEHNRTARRAFSKGVKNMKLKDRLLTRGASSLEDAVSFAIEAEYDSTYMNLSNNMYCNICRSNTHREQNCNRRKPDNLNLNNLLYALNDLRRPYNNNYSQNNNYNNMRYNENQNRNQNRYNNGYQNYNRDRNMYNGSFNQNNRDRFRSENYNRNRVVVYRNGVPYYENNGNGYMNNQDDMRDRIVYRDGMYNGNNGKGFSNRNGNYNRNNNNNNNGQNRQSFNQNNGMSTVRIGRCEDNLTSQYDNNQFTEQNSEN